MYKSITGRGNPGNGKAETMTTTEQVDTRRTDWIAFDHYGYSHYRIWKRVTQFGWEQRHEWKRDDGSVRMEGWIRSAAGVPADFTPEGAA